MKTPLLGYFSKKATAAVPNYMSCTREEKQYIYFVVRHTKENARKERGGGGRRGRRGKGGVVKDGRPKRLTKLSVEVASRLKFQS